MANPVNPNAARIRAIPEPNDFFEPDIDRITDTYDGARKDSPISYNVEGFFHTALASSLLALAIIAMVVGTTATFGIGGVLFGLTALVAGSAILNFVKAGKVKQLTKDGTKYRIKLTYADLERKMKEGQGQAAQVPQVQPQQYQYMQPNFLQQGFVQPQAQPNVYFPGYVPQQAQQQPFQLQLPQPIIPFNPAANQAQR